MRLSQFIWHSLCIFVHELNTHGFMNIKMFFAAVALLTLGVTAGWTSQAQENPAAPAAKKEVRTIIIREGNKSATDTVITRKDVKHFRMDGGKEAVWVATDAMAGSDSLTEEIIIHKGDGMEKRMIIRRMGDGPGRMVIHEETMEGDSGKQVRVFVRNAAPGEEDRWIRRGDGRGLRQRVTRSLEPGTPLPPAFPGARALRPRTLQGPNIINLADPGIISYKKKKMSGGREKITIIRNEVKEVTVKENQILQIDRNLNSGSDEDLERMNAPRVVREMEFRRKELPAPAEAPAPADQK
jgi:hypothetical protein